MDQWSELKPQALASGKTLHRWVRREFYNGMVTEKAGVVHAQWAVGVGGNATMQHAYPPTVTDGMRMIEQASPTGAKR